MQQLQRLAGNAAVGRLLGSRPTVQRAYELCKPADVTHREDHRAHEVEVHNIRGTPLMAAANVPTVAPFGWLQLHAAGHTLANTGAHNTRYNAVRAHLWNGRLGGPGNQTWNLAPAPAQVNSEMSAGPETAAKNLVEAGYPVWLKTSLRYQQASTNANDLTSVVPNHIDMSWGVEGSPGQTWSKDIPLPVDPLQGAAAQEYRDWPAAKTAELVNKLSTETDQVRAQAFDLVQHDVLKWAILHHYPNTYLSFNAATKGTILKGMAAAGGTLLDDFLTNALKVAGNPEKLVDEALLPLGEIGEPLLVQDLFSRRVPAADKRKMLVVYRHDLVKHLGPIAEAFATTDLTIFAYLDDQAKVNLLAGMDKPTLTGFLQLGSSTDRTQVFDTWAAGSGHAAAGGRCRQACADFISGLGTVDDAYKAEYRSVIAGRIRSDDYMSHRPKRERKFTGAQNRTKPY